MDFVELLLFFGAAAMSFYFGAKYGAQVYQEYTESLFASFCWHLSETMGVDAVTEHVKSFNEKTKQNKK